MTPSGSESTVRRGLILDFDAYDLNQVVADLDEIRRHNPQRYESEQLTAICYVDVEKKICVGYKDVRDDEFWVPGHMPGAPIMPGVVMCEVAAQACAYFLHRYYLEPGETVGLGGLDEIRFREVVRPGDRLVVVATMLKHRPKVLFPCRFQMFVGQKLVCEGQIRGIVLPREISRSVVCE
jgi:3-hydroxyacyl-[acyl-carrier-protein] dehydratase